MGYICDVLARAQQFSKSKFEEIGAVYKIKFCILTNIKSVEKQMLYI